MDNYMECSIYFQTSERVAWDRVESFNQTGFRIECACYMMMIFKIFIMNERAIFFSLAETKNKYLTICDHKTNDIGIDVKLED